MNGIIITQEQIEAAAQTKSRKVKHGWLEYIKVDGEWVLDHMLRPDEEKRQSTKIFADGRPAEIIKWAS